MDGATGYLTKPGPSKRDRQNLERQNRDKLSLVGDNVKSCVKSTKILHVLAHIVLGDSP